MTSTSHSWAADGLTATRLDGGRVRVVNRETTHEVVTLDFSEVHAVPAKARSLTDFLDEFEQLEDVKPHVEQARRDVAAERAKSGRVRLSHLRLAKGMSQGELARRLGTSQSAVSNFERRLTKPGEDTIRALARVLEVNFQTLMDALENG